VLYPKGDISEIGSGRVLRASFIKKMAFKRKCIPTKTISGASGIRFGWVENYMTLDQLISSITKSFLFTGKFSSQFMMNEVIQHSLKRPPEGVEKSAMDKIKNKVDIDCKEYLNRWENASY
jgi:hypothetical protein